ncbi:hypothetical protein HDU81_001774 [Chytriomyces hyalinus]|nr:hypothetical protein HDU81_001774 [Chytriomyces hyalinus]
MTQERLDQAVSLNINQGNGKLGVMYAGPTSFMEYLKDTQQHVDAETNHLEFVYPLQQEQEVPLYLEDDISLPPRCVLFVQSPFQLASGMKDEPKITLCEFEGFRATLVSDATDLDEGLKYSYCLTNHSTTETKTVPSMTQVGVMTRSNTGPCYFILRQSKERHTVPME